jgi:hypothetical protein
MATTRSRGGLTKEGPLLADLSRLDENNRLSSLKKSRTVTTGRVRPKAAVTTGRTQDPKRTISVLLVVPIETLLRHTCPAITQALVVPVLAHEHQ